MPNTLQHVGILGMRWGRRKSSSSDYETAKKLKKKKLSEMSNDEIRTLTNRMQLESQYKNLNPGKLSKGRKQLESAIALIGTATAAAVIAKKSYPVAKNIVTTAVGVVKLRKYVRFG